MASFTLTVCPQETESQRLKNCALVNNKSLDGLYGLYNKQLFLINHDESIKINSIAFNMPFLTALKLPHGTNITINLFEYNEIKNNVNSTVKFIVKLIKNTTISGTKINLDIDGETIIPLLIKDFKYTPIMPSFSYYYYFSGLYLRIDCIETDGHYFINDKTNIVLMSGAENIKIKHGDMTETGSMFKGSMNFKELGIGGLDNEYETIFRRAFSTRAVSSKIAEELGVKHVRGILLYGPPGCGKTLIATKLGEALKCEKPEIVSGPSLLSSYVGASEENVRKLFAKAIANKDSDPSKLHLIICDEFDALCKKRGSSSGDTGVGDKIVNQFLSMIDGPEALNNILLIATTNRKDLLDEAILRPGRIEVHIEVGLPDETGRKDILEIHTKKMNSKGYLDKDINLEEIAKITQNFTGAEIESVVKTAVSYAITRELDPEKLEETGKKAKPHITRDDFLRASHEIIPMYGSVSPYIELITAEPLVFYNDKFSETYNKCIETLKAVKFGSVHTLLITGERRCGKTKTVCHMAKELSASCIKFVNSESLIRNVNKSIELYDIFSQTLKAEFPVIILDSIENIIEYSPFGGIFSNNILQVIYTILDAKIQKDKKMIVIMTSTKYELMDRLDLVERSQETVQLENFYL